MEVCVLEIENKPHSNFRRIFIQMNKLHFKTLTISLVLIAMMLGSSGCILPDFRLPQPTVQAPPTSPAVSQPSVSPTTEPIAPGWQPPSSPSAGQPLPDMVSVVALVRLSVVSIDVKMTTYDIFNQAYTEQGAGSGWIIDSNGYIVTNNHVVEGAQEINITLADGRTFPSVTVATDPVSDLAVVKINATNLAAAKLGDSTQLRVGQVVAAIGNALGEGISMTGGWVSQLGVSMTNDSGITLYDLIKTDAAINPGNSGGPLVDTAGEVVGITSAKLVGSSIEGIGYAISLKTALPIIQDLITKGYTVRPWFGINMQTVTDSISRRYQLGVNKGVIITRVNTGSPAALAGLKTGDVIVNIGGKEITKLEDATLAIRMTTIGKAVEIQYYRNKTKYPTSLTPVEAPR
jgi:serine protease Do